jgi:hypothetical protein
MFQSSLADDLRLSEAQLKELDDAERALNESFDAHDKMRAVCFPEGWSKLGPPSNPAIWAIHVRRLATDVRNYVRTGIDVAAQAVFPLGSLEQFRELLPKMAQDIENRALARVNPRDLPLFDAPSVSEFVANRVSEWLTYAERKLKPAWMDKGSDERDTNSKPQQAQPLVRTGAVETDGPRFKDKPMAEMNSSEVDQADKGRDRRDALGAGVGCETSTRIRNLELPTHNWEDIEITLISEERIEIKNRRRQGDLQLSRDGMR